MGCLKCADEFPVDKKKLFLNHLKNPLDGQIVKIILRNSIIWWFLKHLKQFFEGKYVQTSLQ